MTKDDIPSSSAGKRKFKNTLKTQFTFNKTTDREVYELLFILDFNKGPGIDNLDVKSEVTKIDSSYIFRTLSITF